MITTSTSTMESQTRAAPSRLSVCLEPPRPQYSRQRSNSLPAGLANMNAQEAGMLFSAAERATERRRRPFSVHTPYRIDHSERLRAPSHVRFDSGTTIRPSPPPKDTPTQQRPTTSYRKNNNSRALRSLDVNQAINRSISSAQSSSIKPALFPVASPNKRQVTTSSLKSYADGLFQFTQTRLVSTIPNILSPPPSSTNDVFRDMEVPVITSLSPSRPSYESKFSDWSISTCESRQSIIQETVLTIQLKDTDPLLMSPDSFFGGFEETPRRRDFSLKSIACGYPSSEAYGSQPGEHQPLTPPPCMEEPIVSPLEEFSYFTNYDQYVDVDNNCSADINGATEALESLAIEISPMEPIQYALSSPPQLQRSKTSLQPPVLSRSCSSGTSMFTLAASTPVTPYQQARVAVQIPHWLIGAIG